MGFGAGGTISTGAGRGGSFRKSSGLKCWAKVSCLELAPKTGFARSGATADFALGLVPGSAEALISIPPRVLRQLKTTAFGPSSARTCAIASGKVGAK
jgi:hypothetical protein